METFSYRRRRRRECANTVHRFESHEIKVPLQQIASVSWKNVPFVSIFVFLSVMNFNEAHYLNRFVGIK